MADTVDNWMSDSNQALEVSLVENESGKVTAVARFNPKFTYPIFGEEEQIVGYQNLKISLRYHAADMRPHVKVTSGKKFKGVGDSEPTDVESILQEYLPPVAFAKSRDFEDAVRLLPADWTPPGDILSEFDGKDDTTFEIRHANLADPAVKQIIDRIQLFTLLFIEGGSYIADDESDYLTRWDVYFLYCKKPSTSGGQPRYRFAGYSTVYKFHPMERHPIEAKPVPRDDLVLPVEDFSLSSLPSRSRISQFIILPPFQKSGNGPRLYRAIYENCLRDPTTIEVTVEDPNEAFDDMRDVMDLDYLRQQPDFCALKIDTAVQIPKKGNAPRNIIDETKAEEVRCRYRIAPRQFSRVLEMQLMSKLADSVRPNMSDELMPKPTAAEKHVYALWRLLTKQRLYRHNKELLSQVEPGERGDRLNDTLGGIELEYVRILSLCDSRRTYKGKRKLDEDTEGGEDEASLKKARV